MLTKSSLFSPIAKAGTLCPHAATYIPLPSATDPGHGTVLGKCAPFPPCLPVMKSRCLLRTQFPRRPLQGRPFSLRLHWAGGRAGARLPSHCHRQTTVPASFPKPQSVEARAISPCCCRHPYTLPRVTPCYSLVIVTLSNTTLDAFNPICSYCCGLPVPWPAVLQWPCPHSTQALWVDVPTPPNHQRSLFERFTLSHLPACLFTPLSLQTPPSPRCHHVYVPVISVHVRTSFPGCPVLCNEYSSVATGFRPESTGQNSMWNADEFYVE